MQFEVYKIYKSIHQSINSKMNQRTLNTTALMLLGVIPQICSPLLSVFLLTKTAHANVVQQTAPATNNAAKHHRLIAASPNPALEPKAMDLLKQMSDRLAAARTMSFTATNFYESPSRLGPPLIYTTVSEVMLQRPDKLRVITPGDGSASEFYYDGKTMMAYAPAENVVAIADAPPTIDAALKAVHELAEIYFPFTDVLVADPYKDIADELKVAFYIGQSQVIGGVKTDMIAIANDDVFAQVWIGATDKLPRLIRAVYKNDPSRLRHQVAFSNWKLDGAVPTDAFTSSRASNARRIEFKRPDPIAPPTSQSPTNAQPPKSTP